MKKQTYSISSAPVTLSDEHQAKKTLPKRPNFQQACLWICETKNKAILDNLLIFEENIHWLEKEISPCSCVFVKLSPNTS